MMKQFVQLYCQKLDAFNPYMQDCMGKAAFLVCKQLFIYIHVDLQNLSSFIEYPIGFKSLVCLLSVSADL
jgi:hypothetical protein